MNLGLSPAKKINIQRKNAESPGASGRGRALPFNEPDNAMDDKETTINQALASLAAAGYLGLSKSDLGKLNPTDEYEAELQVMSEVRGYFQIAYKVRFGVLQVSRSELTVIFST
jgi:hypothetical protein